MNSQKDINIFCIYIYIHVYRIKETKNGVKKIKNLSNHQLPSLKLKA